MGLVFTRVPGDHYRDRTGAIRVFVVVFFVAYLVSLQSLSVGLDCQQFSHKRVTPFGRSLLLPDVCVCGRM